MKPLVAACGLNVVTAVIEAHEGMVQAIQTTPPDILIWLSTEPLKLAEGQFIDLAVLGVHSENYQGYWLDLGSVDGHWLAMPVQADLKSLIWYSPARLRISGYQPPTTFDQLVALADRMASDGRIPWSIGLESGGATGWTGSDFIQDLLLVQQGPGYVTDIISGRVPHNHSGVVRAYETYLRWASDERYAFGGSTGTLNTNFFDSVFSVFSNPPAAMMVREAGWAGGEIVGHRPTISYGIDYDFFAFPGVQGVQGGADYLMALRDTPATRALVAYLSSATGAKAWAEVGFDLSPNKLALGNYMEPQLAKRAGILARADRFTPDLGDTLGSPFDTAEWPEIVAVLRGGDIPKALSRAAVAQRQALQR